MKTKVYSMKKENFVKDFKIKKNTLLNIWFEN